jgi:RNA polymerase sigma-70 factor (ECF subfamily)
MRDGDDVCSAERLMQLVRGGDPRTLDHITRCYGERLLRAGRRHCRSREEADDAVQEALLTATLQLEQFRGEGSLEGWLVRIVARACRRLGRGQKNDASLHDSDVEPGGTLPSPEDAAAERELGELLDRALLGLSAEDRALLLLAELEDWTAVEIGAELGLSAGAVRTRLSRLRARVRDALEPALSRGV